MFSIVIFDIRSCTSYDMKYVREEEREDDVAREVDEDKNENENHSSGVNRRLTAIGCQNGSLSVFYIDTTCNVILRRWSYENDSFITQLRFFTNHMCYDWHKLGMRPRELTSHRFDHFHTSISCSPI